MFRNIYYDTKRSKIHLWETFNGERLYDTISWVPYVFAKTTEETGTKSIFGDNVKKVEFNNYRAFYEFSKTPNRAIFENNMKPEIQFLADRYYNIPDDDLEIPALRVFYFDIEVYAPNAGFPYPDQAKFPISTIAVYDNFNKKVYCWGTKKYTGENTRMEYFYFAEEKDMLKHFFAFIGNEAPDIITGWSILNFDIPYLYNRSQQFCLKRDTNELFDLISPIGITNKWMRDDKLNIDIAGISMVDYCSLYKKYTTHNHEKHTLDFISNFELEKGKLDYSDYKDLVELYEKDFNKYLDYNIVDAYRVYQLEEKLSYLGMVQSLSLLTKCPMKFYEAVTNLIDAAFLVYYRRHGFCAPRFNGGSKEPFEAAYVKPPVPGKYDWCVDMDVTSMYPYNMIATNMGNETYFGRILNLTESEVIEFTKNRNYPVGLVVHKASGEKMTYNENQIKIFNAALVKRIFTIAPNGVIFDTRKVGIVADIEKYLFGKRKSTKQKMIALKKAKGDEVEINRLHAMQIAQKTLLNSIYGVLSTPHYRGFNLNIADAITSIGRHVIKSGQRFINEICNNPNDDLLDAISEIGKLKKTKCDEIKDFIIYIDTDSLFFSVQDIVLEYLEDPNDWYELTKEFKINTVLKISKPIESYVNTQIYEKTQREDFNSAETEYKINFKQEIVAQSGIWIAKKKYGCWIVNEEGAGCDKLFIRGLEIIRSETPTKIRDMLKDIMSRLLKGESEDGIAEVIIKYKKEILSFSPEEIGANVGAKNFDKYINEDFSTEKGTPHHVKGVANFNRLLDTFGITNKYEPIFDGEKVKVVYLKKNPVKMESLSFKRWPEEFTKHGFEVDNKKMLEKLFIKKIKMLVDPLNLSHVVDENSKNINLFF